MKTKIPLPIELDLEVAGWLDEIAFLTGAQIYEREREYKYGDARSFIYKNATLFSVIISTNGNFFAHRYPRITHYMFKDKEKLQQYLEQITPQVLEVIQLQDEY